MALTTLALEELREGLRNRWALASVLLFGGLALALALLGSAPVGEVRASALTVTLVSLSSLSVYLVPIIALLLSFDAVVGERERGTLLLLLTYPVARWHVVVGKFLGHTLILGIAVTIGYGIVGVVLVAFSDDGTQGWRAYAAMMASTWLLGAVFAAVGGLVSVLVRQRATAAGVVIGLWLGLVVLYDLALLAVLLGDARQALSSDVFALLMAVNPIDSYRIFNLSGADSSGLLAGMAGMGAETGLAPVVLLTILFSWTVVPVLLSIVALHRQEL
jgi:Cu-processing system permease protein